MTLEKGGHVDGIFPPQKLPDQHKNVSPKNYFLQLNHQVIDRIKNAPVAKTALYRPKKFRPKNKIYINQYVTFLCGETR